MPEQRSQSNNVVLIGFEELPPKAVTQQVRVDFDARDRRVLREQRSDPLGRQRSPLAEENERKAEVAPSPEVRLQTSARRKRNRNPSLLVPFTVSHRQPHDRDGEQDRGSRSRARPSGMLNRVQS